MQRNWRKSWGIWLALTGAAFAVGGIDENQAANERRHWKEGDIPERSMVTRESRFPAIERARQIILETHLDDFLTNHTDDLKQNVAEADGQLALGDYLMLRNAADLRDFIKEHGYAGFRGPVEIREGDGSRLEVAVRIAGADRHSMVLWIKADGSRQGAG